jgi:phospholipase/carboxylesterase
MLPDAVVHGELDHLLREPQGEPEGALILNHGRGADERDLYGLLDALDPERRLLGVTTGAPLTGIPPGGRHWYLVPRVGCPDPATFASSYRALTEFLDGLLAEREIPWERTAIGGFSMGTVMSYAVALGEGRPSPAAILANSGFIPTVDGWRPELAGREGLPVLIHHGRNDPVISVEFARAAASSLDRAGLEVEYVETDAGHWLPPEILPAARDLVSRVTVPKSGEHSLSSH